MRADADDQPKGPSVTTPRVGLGLGRGTLDRHHRVNPSKRLDYDSCGRGAEEGIIDRKEGHCYNDRGGAHSSDLGDVHTTTIFNDDMMTIRRQYDNDTPTIGQPYDGNMMTIRRLVYDDHITKIICNGRGPARGGELVNSQQST